MPAAIRLGDAIEEYLGTLQNQGRSASTIKCKKSALLRFLSSTGNIYVKNLEPRHADMWLGRNTSWEPATRKVNIRHLSAFQKWLITRRYAPRDHDFLEGLRDVTVAKKRRPRVQVEDFDRLLGLAGAPRDRIVVALGLHLMLRVSELTPIQWKHVDLDGGYVQVYRKKTGQHDDLPVSADLEAELAAWRREVCVAMGVTMPDPEWYVCCQMRRPETRDPRGFFISEPGNHPLLPDLEFKNPGARVKKLLAGVGITERGARMHVLRRSGAVATRDWLMESEGEGRDRALTTVQSFLGHADQSTTQVYLDDQADRNTRNALIRGRQMFKKNDQEIGGKVLEMKRRE